VAARIRLHVQVHSQKITTFNVPGAGTGAYQGTLPWPINSEGAITGYYVDASNAAHGFLRAPDGAITTFDPKGSIYTVPVSNNPAGAITGYYLDANDVYHGFLRE
jgi:hypothetical protein